MARSRPQDAASLGSPIARQRMHPSSPNLPSFPHFPHTPSSRTVPCSACSGETRVPDRHYLHSPTPQLPVFPTPPPRQPSSARAPPPPTAPPSVFHPLPHLRAHHHRKAPPPRTPHPVTALAQYTSSSPVFERFSAQGVGWWTGEGRGGSFPPRVLHGSFPELLHGNRLPARRPLHPRQANGFGSSSAVQPATPPPPHAHRS